MHDIALRSAGFDPIRNLALEESILERGRGFDRVLFLYVNDPCIVIGRNQNPWMEVSARSALPVLRRVSGGGAVYHDRGNLNWGIVVPRSRHDPASELALISGAMRRLGVEAVSGPRGGLFVADDGPWKGAKLSGTARRLTAARALHHGTLLVDADLGRLGSCLGGIEAERSLALPSVRSASANLSSVVPGLCVDDAALAIAQEFSGFAPEPAEAFADPEYTGRAALRLASWEWTWGATPAFWLSLPCRGGSIQIEIKGGSLASASGPGAERVRDFLGRPFEYGLPASIIEALDSRG
jgi:lipoate---protein ligase